MESTYIVKICNLAVIDVNLDKDHKEVTNLTLFASKRHREYMDGRRHRVLLFVPRFLALIPRKKSASLLVS
jgi:hypothetical protein